jgi:hypothetical protein
MSEPPHAIVDLAAARADARARRDWAEADRLRAEIETSGWKVVDDGLAFRLVPLHLPDVVVDGRVLHGHPGSVPSRLDEPPRGLATVVVSLDGPERAPAVVERLGARSPAGTEIVLVVGVDPGAVDRVPAAAGVAGEAGLGVPVESVLTAGSLGLAGALDAGIRRAGAPIVILLADDAEPAGDIVSPLVRALHDPTVAIAGARGLAAPDLRRPAPASVREAVAVDLGCAAFRRADYAERGPLDRRLHTEPYLALWWGLILREPTKGRPARRAAVLDDLPVALSPWAGAHDGAARSWRRDHYRLLDRFGGRRDLFEPSEDRP